MKLTGLARQAREAVLADTAPAADAVLTVTVDARAADALVNLDLAVHARVAVDTCAHVAVQLVVTVAVCAWLRRALVDVCVRMQMHGMTSLACDVLKLNNCVLGTHNVFSI